MNRNILKNFLAAIFCIQFVFGSLGLLAEDVSSLAKSKESKMTLKEICKIVAEVEENFSKVAFSMNSISSIDCKLVFGKFKKYWSEARGAQQVEIQKAGDSLNKALTEFANFSLNTRGGSSQLNESMRSSVISYSHKFLKLCPFM